MSDHRNIRIAQYGRFVGLGAGALRSRQAGRSERRRTDTKQCQHLAPAARWSGQINRSLHGRPVV
jgi:hypothetical protein